MEQSIIQQVQDVGFDWIEFLKDWAGILSAFLVPAVGVIIRQHYSIKRLNGIIDKDFVKEWPLMQERLKIAREDIKQIKKKNE